jgi:hypothetical protein
MVMMVNITFNNSSVISWQSILLVEEIGILVKKTTDPPQATDKLYHIILDRVHLGISYIRYEYKTKTSDKK